MNTSFKETAFLIKLDTTQSFRGIKKDKKSERDLQVQHELDKPLHRVQKQMFPSAYFAEIDSVRKEARQIAYKFGYPWSDAGYRIVAAALSIDLFQEFNDLYVNRWLPAVQRFKDKYEERVKEAVESSNGVITYDEFPPASSLEFGMKWDILPLPTKDDFRFDLPGASNEKAIEDAMAKVNDAHKNNYDVLRDIVATLVEFTHDPDKTLHETTFSKFQEIVARADRANFMGDPILDDIVKDIKGMMPNFDDVKRVRKDKDFRASLGEPMKKLQDDIESKMSGLFDF